MVSLVSASPPVRRHHRWIHVLICQIFPCSHTSQLIFLFRKDVSGQTKVVLCKLRGQCYDGAAAMRGIRSGVTKRILDKEPRAVYTHCYGHSINLAMNDSIKACKPVKKSLEVTHEVTKLIKYSPHREGIFQQLKDNHDISVGYHTPGVRVLCPTRWTVCANALASVTSNFEILLNTWDEAAEIV